MIIAPLEIVGITVILYISVGKAAIVGVTVCFALVIYHLFNGLINARVR